LALASLAGPAAAQAGDYGAPDGWYPYAVSITKASQNPIVLDGRSPDTRDASQAAQASSSYSAAIKALFARSQGLNDLYGNAVTRLSSKEFIELYNDGGSKMSPEALNALVVRGQALNSAGYGSQNSAGYGSPDGWYPYVVSLTKANQSPAIIDGRSPDTVDFAVQAHSPLVSITGTPGFHWGDFGIGSAAALGAMLLLLLSMRSLATRQGRKQPPVATT
jgi:hypothetical protein